MKALRTLCPFHQRHLVAGRAIEDLGAAGRIRRAVLHFLLSSEFVNDLLHSDALLGRNQQVVVTVDAFSPYRFQLRIGQARTVNKVTPLSARSRTV
jgi:hypothetical protein